MSVQTFNLPDLGEGLTEGEVVSWLVAVGDHVEVDQPVAEVETAKAVVEIPCPFAGVVTQRHAEPGEEVEVGSAFLSIDRGGADSPEAAPADATEGDQAPAGDGPADDGNGDDASGSVLVGYGTARPRRSRRQRTPGGQPHDGGSGLDSGAGVGADVGAAGGARAGGSADVDGQAGPGPNGTPTGPHGKPLAKPPVRKLAKDLGVDLSEVTPSGPDGIITREDVQSAAQRQAAADEPVAGEPAAAAPEPAAAEPAAASAERAAPEREPVGAASPAPAEDVERIALSATRRRIAERMTTSRREIPSATTWVQADATALMKLRADLDASTDERVSPLALLLRITVAGLRRVRELNAHFDAHAQEVVQHRAVHLGVAVDTDRGLLVPVIRDADRRSTLELSAEVTRLAQGARTGTLAPAEMTGSTFTVSNYGSFGVDGGDPVINHPEVGILGVGQITQRPWVVDGAVEARHVVELSVAFDHRVCDGGPAAQFLRFVADCVEDPVTLLGAL